MEEGVYDKNDDKSGKYDEEKESEFLYDTATDDMEEGATDKNDDKNEKTDEEKEA